MSKHRLTGSLLWLALISGAQSLGAQRNQAMPTSEKPKPKQPALVVESLRKISNFQSDGTGVQDYTGVFHVLQESALKNLAVLVFGYSNESETIDVDYVRVRKADGAVILTPPESIQDLSAAVTRQAPIYSDAREKHIAVKGLSVGDILEFHIRRIIKKDEIPGQIWLSIESPFADVVKEQIDQVSLPIDKAYQTVCHGKDPEVLIEGGRRILRWKQSNPEVQDPPARAPWAGKPAPGIQLTTFQSWRELGEWYRGLQDPQMQPTDSIKKKAKELTDGLKSEKERIQALYYFVSTKIHYVGLSFGIGRYRPHSAENVLSNGYGDCKDKHTLLAGLMKAVGLEAWPALIRAAGDIDPEVPSPSQFDHVITVVPLGGEWLWLDTTPEVGPFGYLSLGLRGKPALVIPNSTPALLKNTPEELPFPQENRFTFKGKLQEGGRIEGHCEVSLRGDGELMFRQAFRQVPQNRWREFLSNMVSPIGIGYEFDSIQPGVSENTGTPFTFGWDLKRHEASDWEKRRVIVPLLPFGIEHLSKIARKPSDPIFLPTPGGTVIYRAQLELPAGANPTLPSSCNLSCPNAEYHATYSFEKGVVSVERRMTTRGGAIVGKDRAAFNTFCQGVISDEDQYVSLGGVDPEVASEDPEAIQWFNKGVEAQQRQDFLTAREAFRKTIERSPKFPGAHAGFGLTYVAKGDFQTGIQELQKEEELHPESPMAYRILGSVYASMGQKANAIAHWKSAVRIDPDNRDSLEVLLDLLRGEKRYREAADHLEQTVKRSPGNAGDTLRLAEEYSHTDQTAKVEFYAREAVRLSETPEFLTRSARALVEAGQALDQAKAWNEKAGAMLDAQSLAIGSDYQKGLSNTVLLSGVWETTGRILLKEGDPKEALRFLRSAWSLTLSGSCGDALAQTFERLGRAKDAARYYELAAVANGADQVGIARRYRKLTGHDLANGMGHFYKNGKMLPSPADHLIELRSAHFPNTKPLGVVNAVVVATNSGVESVHFPERSEEFDSHADVAKAIHLHLEFPDSTPRRIYLRGGMDFGPRGGTFIFVVP